MAIIRSDGLASLVSEESELNNMCDPNIEDFVCSEDKLSSLIKKMIEQYAVDIQRLEAGEGISISPYNIIKFNKGTGLVRDVNNNINVDLSAIPTPKDGTCIDVSDTGTVNLKIGSGLKNASDLVAIDYGSLPLVTPALISETKEYNIGKSTLLRTLTVNNPAIEEGAVLDIVSKYKYILGSSYSAPDTVTGDYSTTIPADNTFSADLLISNYAINTNVDNLLKTVNFVKPKSGLNVVNGKVVEPVGNDTTSASYTSTIVYPFYIGPATTTTITQINLNSFTKRLNVKSGSITFNNVTTDGTQYLFFVFPSDVSLNNVIMDGAAPVFGAFINVGTAQFVTSTGKTKTMNIFRSTAKGAFGDNSLRFEFTQL